MNNFQHYTVMKEETLQYFDFKGDKIFVDATLGGGGHSKVIAERMSKNSKLICFDVDQDAIDYAKEVLKSYKNVCIIKDSYVNLKQHLEEMGIEKITGGIVFDVGASYHQLTCPDRGFSFMKDAELDMRFDKSGELTAKDIINHYKEGDLVRIFSEYGEEHFSKRIAKAIVNARPIHTTLQLAELIKKSIPKTNTKKHCATRVFQALRIEVNSELENLKITLDNAVHLLSLGGIISVISFHSLEDRIVKNTFKNYSKSCRCEKNQPVCACEGKILEVINKKPIVATKEELKINPPSASAKLRIAKRI